MIRDYKEGARVYIDEECMETIKNNRNTVNGMFPCDSWLKTAGSVMKKVGTVTKRFKPGYEFNVEWDVPYFRDFDGVTQDVTILQVKDNWVKPLDNEWERM